ncbi:hypothetical protein [Pandoraea iniqua]|uniref:hypothetical protein n=1 Tax=Pandoraea iniqua TaxID=2508288 RepID=UPI0012420AF3|nr:hypothetical protein [Pandoraea iniqua]
MVDWTLAGGNDPGVKKPREMLMRGIVDQLEKGGRSDDVVFDVHQAQFFENHPQIVNCAASVWQGLIRVLMQYQRACRLSTLRLTPDVTVTQATDAMRASQLAHMEIQLAHWLRQSSPQTGPISLRKHLHAAAAKFVMSALLEVQDQMAEHIVVDLTPYDLAESAGNVNAGEVKLRDILPSTFRMVLRDGRYFDAQINYLMGAMDDLGKLDSKQSFARAKALASERMARHVNAWVDTGSTTERREEFIKVLRKGMWRSPGHPKAGIYDFSAILVTSLPRIDLIHKMGMHFYNFAKIKQITLSESTYWRAASSEWVSDLEKSGVCVDCPKHYDEYEL